MLSEEEKRTLKNYFNKLIKTIETQSSFQFGNKRIVNKQRIDDILCCIDIAFPPNLKKYKSHYGETDKNVKSFRIYEKLISNIKIKPFFLFGTTAYAVNYSEVLELSNQLGFSLAEDDAYIDKTYPNINE